MNKKEFIETYPDTKKWMNHMPDDIFSRGRIRGYKNNEIIKRVGEKISSVYIVCSGTIMISSSNIEGQEMSVTLVKAGSLVGEMEALNNKKVYTYTVKGFKKGVIFELLIKDFLVWIDKEHRVCRHVCEILAEKLYLSSSATVQYNSWNASARLIVFLINCGSGKVNFSRTEIATACGVCERTIYREIAKLKNEGYIDIKNKNIYISSKQIEMMIDNVPV